VIILFAVIGVTVAALIGILFYKMREVSKGYYDPFGYCPHCNVMITELHCPDCNMKCVRAWANEDFVGKTTDEKCTTVCKEPKCQGKLVITGIWCEKRKTKEELEYEKLVSKWQ
jgi:hypothetical protein